MLNRSAMNSKTIKFNKASFNAEFGSKKTEEEFIAHFAPQFFLNLKLSDRQAILKEAYQLCCKQMGVEPRGFDYTKLAVPESQSELPDELTDEQPSAEEHDSPQEGRTKRRGR